MTIKKLAYVLMFLSITSIFAVAIEHTDPQTYVVTSAEHDGPHPPFVSSSRRLLAPPELPDAPDEWIDHSLQWVDYILVNYPPEVQEFPERRLALYRLDEILHIQSAPEKPLVQAFYKMRMERAIQDIERTKVTHGMRIWKLYNDGFVVRTPSVTFAYDIVPGPPTFSRGPNGAVAFGRVPGFSISQEWLHRLVGQCDALFISHQHRDHASKQVVAMFLAEHKPVIAPEGLWSGDPKFSKLTYPERSAELVHEIRIKSGSEVLKVVSHPGHQGKVLNNVNLVTTPEGFTVIETGDQSGQPGDFAWLSQIGHYHHVDVLMVDGWAPGLHRIVRGVNPEIVITGHEDEMAHVVSHREEYGQTYERMFGLHYPYLVMTWGESYLYKMPTATMGVLPDEN